GIKSESDGCNIPNRQLAGFIIPRSCPGSYAAFPNGTDRSTVGDDGPDGIVGSDQLGLELGHRHEPAVLAYRWVRFSALFQALACVVSLGADVWHHGALSRGRSYGS